MCRIKKKFSNCCFRKHLLHGNQLYKNPCESCLEAGLKKGNTGRSLSEAEAVNQETKEMFAELGKENERITAHPDQTVTYENRWILMMF